ncbi:putative uncharacterized protein DDB_G0267716 isoform X1 [Anthonomus grandis grandis]|uniref:putative uncharacterized protein DDB_G0267716 isoform X1 n=1 Tax=Anthonomus grandis grandis TaxID=2921223 RepID=UPI002165F52D|nr:putative uncharacterized protein DDB_G0267716 isoform X1 [Anthonomus grandis grandis]
MLKMFKVRSAMDRTSSGFKLLSLTRHPTNALKDIITNDSSATLTGDSIELNTTIKLFKGKDQDNHTDTKSAENEKCFEEEDEEKLQSALAELHEEIHMTENIFRHRRKNDLSSSFFNNAIISGIEQTDTNFDSFIFSDEMLNANTTNDIDAPTETPLDLEKNLQEGNISNEDNDEEDAKNHPEEEDNENNDPTYQIGNDREQYSDEENNDSSEEVSRKRKK